MLNRPHPATGKDSCRNLALALLKPHVAHLIVCNPRKNALLKHGNKSDKIDARKLADRLRLNDLKPVYHGETGVRMLRELARSYLTVIKDQPHEHWRFLDVEMKGVYIPTYATHNPVKQRLDWGSILREKFGYTPHPHPVACTRPALRSRPARLSEYSKRANSFAPTSGCGTKPRPPKLREPRKTCSLGRLCRNSGSRQAFWARLQKHSS